jgi:hypothetical protein
MGIQSLTRKMRRHLREQTVGLVLLPSGPEQAYVLMVDDLDHQLCIVLVRVRQEYTRQEPG